MAEQEKKLYESEIDINMAIRSMNTSQYGVIDSEFLERSVGTLAPALPVCVVVETTIHSVLMELKSYKVGCVLVVDDDGKLIGIFSERDFVLKVFNCGKDLNSCLVGDFMTKEPVSVLPEISIAYALNLMSQGGFRHLPMVDQDNIPVGIISVKDIVDAIGDSFVDDLLNFSLDLEEN